MRETFMSEVRDARLNWYIALGNQFNWGKAESEKAAVANMKRQSSRKTTEYIVYAATKDTYVNGMGGLTRPNADPAAIKIKHIKVK